MLTRLLRAIERIVQVGIWVNGALLVLVAVLIGVDVLARKLFAMSIGGSDEIGGYVLAISSAWAASYTLLKRSHIRMDTVYSLLGPRPQAVLDLTALLALALFLAAVTWYGSKVFLTSVDFSSRSNTPLGTSLWIPQGLWVVGLIMFMFTITAVIGATIAAMFGHTSDEIRRVTGVTTADEVVRDEMVSVRDRLASADSRPTDTKS